MRTFAKNVSFCIWVMKNGHFLRVSHKKRALAPRSYPRPYRLSANFGLVTMMMMMMGPGRAMMLMMMMTMMMGHRGRAMMMMMVMVMMGRGRAMIKIPNFWLPSSMQQAAGKSWQSFRGRIYKILKGYIWEWKMCLLQVHNTVHRDQLSFWHFSSKGSFKEAPPLSSRQV